MTTSTTQNNKLFNVEVTREPPLHPKHYLLTGAETGLSLKVSTACPGSVT